MNAGHNRPLKGRSGRSVGRYLMSGMGLSLGWGILADPIWSMNREAGDQQKRITRSYQEIHKSLQRKNAPPSLADPQRVRAIDWTQLSSELRRKYPDAVPINLSGDPDFSPYQKCSEEGKKITVEPPLSFFYPKQIEMANKMAGYCETPEGWCWYENEYKPRPYREEIGTRVMILVPIDLRDAVCKLLNSGHASSQGALPGDSSVQPQEP